VKPYYSDDAVTIYHGDCREILPPDVGFLAGLVASSRSAAIFGYPEILVGWCVEAGLKPDEWVTWWPTNKPGGRSRPLPSETEHIAMFGAAPGAGTIVRRRSEDATCRAIAISRGNDPDWCLEGDVWREPSPAAGFNAGRLHINEKPLAVLAKLVRLLSVEGDVVLDPFAGSGTTLRAAKDLGRKAIGIEIEERYCEIAAHRCAQDVLDLGTAA
jgi:hypothetical protein